MKPRESKVAVRLELTSEMTLRTDKQLSLDEVLEAVAEEADRLLAAGWEPENLAWRWVGQDLTQYRPKHGRPIHRLADDGGEDAHG